MSKIAVGKKVPEFALESSGGAWRLKDAAGKKVGSPGTELEFAL